MPQENAQNQDLQQALQPLREAIDAIDDQLLALLNRRMEYVRKVGQIKERYGLASFIRPEREDFMLRDIMRRQQVAPFPAVAAAQIWRLIITASLDTEKPMRIAVAAPGNDLRLLVLARDYFGGFVEMELCETAQAALDLVAAEKAAVAVVPALPETSGEQWPHCRVFATLPAPALSASSTLPGFADAQAVAVAKFTDA